MTTTNNPGDVLDFNDGMTKKLPTGINVLTILTFIGCAVFAIILLAMPLISDWSVSMMDKAVSSGQELTQKQLEDMRKAKDAIALAKANQIPNLVSGFLGLGLCLMGAILMRKLKKDGFWIYVAGQVLPIIAGLFIMGSAQYTGVMSYILGIGVPLLFIFLYARQRKFLIK